MLPIYLIIRHTCDGYDDYYVTMDVALNKVDAERIKEEHRDYNLRHNHLCCTFEIKECQDGVRFAL